MFWVSIHRQGGQRTEVWRKITQVHYVLLYCTKFHCSFNALCHFWGQYRHKSGQLTKKLGTGSSLCFFIYFRWSTKVFKGEPKHLQATGTREGEGYSEEKLHKRDGILWVLQKTSVHAICSPEASTAGGGLSPGQGRAGVSPVIYSVIQVVRWATISGSSEHLLTPTVLEGSINTLVSFPVSSPLVILLLTAQPLSHLWTSRCMFRATVIQYPHFIHCSNYESVFISSVFIKHKNSCLYYLRAVLFLWLCLATNIMWWDSTILLPRSVAMRGMQHHVDVSCQNISGCCALAGLRCILLLCICIFTYVGRLSLHCIISTNTFRPVLGWVQHLVYREHLSLHLFVGFPFS